MSSKKQYLKSPAASMHYAARNVKRARIAKDQRGGNTKHQRHIAATTAAAKARAVIPGLAVMGCLSIVYLPSKPTDFGGIISPSDSIQRAGRLLWPSPESLLRTLAVFAASGVVFNELAIAHPLRVLIVSTRNCVADDLAKIVTDHALLPKERITVHQIGHDEFGTFVCGDLFRVARIAKPQIIFWECSLGIRELALPYIGDVRAAHVILTDTAPIPAPAKPFHSCDVRPIVEQQSVLTVKQRCELFRIVGEDRKTRAAFTVADEGRIEPVPIKDKLNLKTRLSAARGDGVQNDETEMENEQ